MASEQSVATFFDQVMAAIGGNMAGTGGDVVVNVYIHHEKKFAFVEMRSIEEASNAMALDGVIFEGAPVKVKRPSDYNPSLAANLGPSQPNSNLNLSVVGLTPAGSDRIFVGGLPHNFTEAMVRELLESFGSLRSFDLVKNRGTGNSRGYAFCVYQDVSVTDVAWAVLNAIQMGNRTLTVGRADHQTKKLDKQQESLLLHAQEQIAMALTARLANQGHNQPKHEQQSVLLQNGLQEQNGVVATKVVCLTLAVSTDKLKDMRNMKTFWKI